MYTHQQVAVANQAPTEESQLHHTQGRSSFPFRVGGRLIEWDITDRLGEITVPTLMVGAEYDTMDPDKMTQQANLVANGRSLHCYNGSHLCMWDDRDAFMGGVASFIEDVEAGRPMR